MIVDKRSTSWLRPPERTQHPNLLYNRSSGIQSSLRPVSGGYFFVYFDIPFMNLGVKGIFVVYQNDVVLEWRTVAVPCSRQNFCVVFLFSLVTKSNKQESVHSHFQCRIRSFFLIFFLSLQFISLF